MRRGASRGLRARHALLLSIAAVRMMCIALAVKLASRGPVFFRQRGYGLNGEVIHVLKFRSMTVAEDGDEVTQATKNDPRITPFGAFMRRTSLDELPQLMHVVKIIFLTVLNPKVHRSAY